MFNEMLCLEVILLIVVFLFLQIQEIATMWYLAGIYLCVIGFNLLRQEGDIFVGFLWVIDLGVGLIFFIFILHLANFLTQKAYFNIASKSSIWIGSIALLLGKYCALISFPVHWEQEKEMGQLWLISWYDYYEFFTLTLTTDLGLIKEIYFVNNSLEFVFLNFVLVYGIVTAIALSFWIRKILSRLHVDTTRSEEPLFRADAIFFIRTQNLIAQQQQTTETRIWRKGGSLKKATR